MSMSCTVVTIDVWRTARPSCYSSGLQQIASSYWLLQAPGDVQTAGMLRVNTPKLTCAVQVQQG
jgi:hypothetical protein